MPTRARYDGEDLGAGEGLLVAAARLLDGLAEGESLEIFSEHPTVIEDMRAWIRRAGHTLLVAEKVGSQTRLLIRRGFVKRTLADAPEFGLRAERPGDMRTWRVGRSAEILAEVPAHGMLAPRGSALEAGSVGIAFSLHRRVDVWAEEVADLYEQATASQWQGATDIPWSDLGPLDPEVERSVCQIMTFLAENEYAALYVPARFMGQIHPHYTEIALFVATVLADEARHIEVFTKRALANGGGLGVASAATQLSLTSLLQIADYSTASFLLSVLGEGTFLDLLAFLDRYAPDPVTSEICRRARRDESRHVHFGIAHARLAMAENVDAARRFGQAVEARAEFLKAVTGVGALIEESLVIYAGGGMHPSALRVGARRVAELYETMHQGRLKRLASVGFDTRQAEHLSRLHTPNFM